MRKRERKDKAKKKGKNNHKSFIANLDKNNNLINKINNAVEE